MRLHRLEITAFGPFSGTEVIDFEALSDAGLFLIHGQTGAGKTSVLDAVCFALYGQVPGARNAVKGLRSDHAAPELGPRVVLETTLRGRRFRITRSPAWDRPKKRGSGTTVEQARIIVEELVGGAWIGLSTRLDEAGDLIGRLLGMTAAQFCQVALLPQGDFAAFLRAGAEERRKVLERLFATEVFTQVEGWLADQRAATRREAAELRAAAESTADRIAEASGTERPGAVLVPEPRQGEPAEAPLETIEALLPWATELDGQLDAVRRQAHQLASEYAGALDDARGAAERGRTTADRQRRYADAIRRREALGERAAERAELTARLADAVRTDRVVPLIEGAMTRARHAEHTRRQAAEARAAVAEMVPSAAPDDVLAKAERARHDEVAGLERLRGDAVRQRTLTGETAETVRRIARLEAKQNEIEALLAELPALVEEGRAELEAVRIRVAGRPGAEAAVQDVARRAGAARRRQTVEAALAMAEDAQRAAVDEAQALRERLQGLRQARLDGMAAALAAELVPGDPCMVCGSEDHPAPAGTLGIVPTVDDEENAHAAYEQAQTAREQSSTRVAELRTELDSLLEATEEPLDTLTAELTAAEQTLAALDADATLVEELDRRLARAELELTQARDKREAVLQELTGERTRRDELLAETARLGELLDAARGTDATLEARIGRLRGEAELLRGAAEAARRAATAAEELSAARTAAETAAVDVGFAGVHAVRQAALDEETRARLRDRLRAFETEDAAVQGLLDDAELTAAAARPAPDLPALEAALAAAQAAAATATSSLDRARQRSDRLAELRAALAARVSAWRPAAERHAVAARLAGLTSGQLAANRLGMRLSAYVLAARLEQVVAAANERLARMSAGRYALLHTVDRAAGDRRGGSGGLGLRVADSWTGQEREPVTLSGGESFIASLALALGLADVVSTETSGGTEINTLFVDEGFGTLDEETLDEVMDVLDGLRDGGRAVGIVSHVAELRTRIPARLCVRKERTGSKAKITV